MCAARGSRAASTDERFAIDNGAMIAVAALMHLNGGAPVSALADCNVAQRWRTDSIGISYRA